MADNYNYNGSYRIRAGTWGANQLPDSYSITSLTRQADQPGMVDWSENLEGSDVYHDFGEIVLSMDGSGKTIGIGNFTWFGGYWSPFMVKYIIDHYPPGDYTVMTFDRGAGWLVLNVTLQPIDKTKGQPVGFGYMKVPMEFVNGTLAAAGFAFDESFSNDFDSPG